MGEEQSRQAVEEVEVGIPSLLPEATASISLMNELALATAKGVTAEKTLPCTYTNLASFNDGTYSKSSLERPQWLGYYHAAEDGP